MKNMIVSEKGSDGYKLMRDSYIELKVILISFYAIRFVMII